MVGNLLGWFRERFPHRRTVIYVITALQAIVAIVSYGGRMLDAYNHAQFYLENREQIIHAMRSILGAIFSPTGSIITVMAGVGYLILDSRNLKKTVAVRVVEPARSDLPVALPSLPLNPEILKPTLRWVPLSADDLLTFITLVEPRAISINPSLQVKFIATHQGHPMAALLSKTLSVLGYEIMINCDDASYIFPARNEIDGIVVRYPQGRPSGMPLKLNTGINSTGLSSQFVEFPKSEQFNFIQIEIGNRTVGSQWE